jgi:hypothetical protein
VATPTPTEEHIALVRQLFENAAANEFPMGDVSDEDVAIDMNRYASDVEGWEHEYLVAVIKAARAAEKTAS